MADLTLQVDIDTFLSSADNAAARTNLGLGTAATRADAFFATGAEGDLAASALQSADIGTSVQAWDALLDGTTASFTTAIAAEVTANTAKVTYPTADSTKLAGYSPIAIITDATTARSLALTDIGGYIRLTNAASCTITLPANATVAWASETEPPTIYFRVAAAGIPTLSNAGVTVNDTLGVVAALEAGSTFALQWVATDVWDII